MHEDLPEWYLNLWRSFPSVAHAFIWRDGKPVTIEPGDFELLDEWALNFAGSGAKATAQFLLDVWTKPGGRIWKAGAFDLFTAIRVWDSAHFAAFNTWVQSQRPR
jgi:hypothetical protein